MRAKLKGQQSELNRYKVKTLGTETYLAEPKATEASKISQSMIPRSLGGGLTAKKECSKGYERKEHHENPRRATLVLTP